MNTEQVKLFSNREWTRTQVPLIRVDQPPFAVLVGLVWRCAFSNREWTRMNTNVDLFIRVY